MQCMMTLFVHDNVVGYRHAVTVTEVTHIGLSEAISLIKLCTHVYAHLCAHAVIIQVNDVLQIFRGIGLGMEQIYKKKKINRLV